MELMTKFGVLRIIALVAVIVVADTKPASKPASNYFTICSRGDPKALEECVKQNIIDLKPQLQKGIPALGVIPLEPLIIPKISFNEAGSFVLDTTMTNVVLKGVGDFSVNTVGIKLDDNSLTGKISITLPDLKITGDYEMDGKILLLPISGRGNFEINTTDLITEISFAGKAVNRNGKRYMEMSNVKVSLILNGVSRSWFYNLFNGQRLLGDATNAFLNNNYKETHEATRHLPEGAFGEMFKNVVSKIFAMYSIDELFTD